MKELRKSITTEDGNVLSVFNTEDEDGEYIVMLRMVDQEDDEPENEAWEIEFNLNDAKIVALGLHEVAKFIESCAQE